MLTAYIFSAVIGIGLIVLSLFGGEHDHDADSHFEIAPHGDHEGTHDHDSHTLWLPFLSIRFWTYFCAAFGASGLLLMFWSPLLPSETVVWAISTGVASGLLSAFVNRLAKKSEVNSGSGLEDTLGLEARVVVAIRPGQPGRIRCTVKGDIIDFMAVADSQQSFEAGESVVVVAVENEMLRVIGKDALFEENAVVRS